MGDRIQLQQVILNLVLNASDAMSNIHDRPRRLVISTEREDDDYVRLMVRDAGMGFDPQSVNRLFEAFYTTKSGGMGIGLSVSRSIIKVIVAACGRYRMMDRAPRLHFHSLGNPRE